MRSDQDIWKCEEAGQLVILENLSREIFEENALPTDIQHHRDPEPDHAITAAKLLRHDPAFQSNKQGTHQRQPDVTAPMRRRLHRYTQFLQVAFSAFGSTS